MWAHGVIINSPPWRKQQQINGHRGIIQTTGSLSYNIFSHENPYFCKQAESSTVKNKQKYKL
jgi:hypothetical protein